MLRVDGDVRHGPVAEHHVHLLASLGSGFLSLSHSLSPPPPLRFTSPLFPSLPPLVWNQFLEFIHAACLIPWTPQTTRVHVVLGDGTVTNIAVNPQHLRSQPEHLRYKDSGQLGQDKPTPG